MSAKGCELRTFFFRRVACWVQFEDVCAVVCCLIVAPTLFMHRATKWHFGGHRAKERHTENIQIINNAMKHNLKR